MLTERRWIVFEDAGTTASGKTRRWTIRAKAPNALLGIVQWRAGWRCYVFEPAFPTVYEEDCLRDIASFIEEATRKHKERNEH